MTHRPPRPLRRLLSLVLALALALSLTACNSDEADPPAPTTEQGAAALREGALRLPLLSLPYTFNPDAMDEDAAAISENLFSRLLKINSKQEVLPDLATDWSYNDSCTQLTLTLRQGVLWHDGQPLTVDDVTWTLNAIRTQVGVLYEQFLYVSDIWHDGESKIYIAFTQSSPFFHYVLTEEAASILPSHLYSGYDWLTAPAVTSPVGTGPFRFGSRDEAGGTIVLEKNEDYYGGAPRLNRLVFQYYSTPQEARAAFERGELEVLTVGYPLSVLPEYEQNPAITLLRRDDASRIQLAFNVGEGVFHNNPVLRFAIASAIDREQLLTESLYGVGAVSTHFLSPLFADTILETATIPAFNRDRVEESLSTLYTKNEEGRYLRLTLSVCDVEPYPELAALIKSQLAEVGIEVTVIQTDRLEWEATVISSGQYEMTLYGGTQGPYPEAILHRTAIGGQLNVMRYQNTTVSDKLYAAITQPNRGLSAQYLKEVQTIFAEQLPFLPLLEWYTVTPAASYLADLPQTGTEVSVNDYSRTYFLG